MTKILGLDLGTNSIGWAVIDKEKQKIIDSGVRIFPEGVVKETIGQGDKEISKNAERREHRQARRQHFRKRIRKIQLLRLLIERQMCPLTTDELNQWSHWDKHKKSTGRQFPSSEPFYEWLRMNPYVLRVKAQSEFISLFEFGRILYHFIHRRGFLSSRKGSIDGAIYKGKDNMAGIEQTRQMIGSGTLGQKLFEILPKEGAPFKRIVDEEGNEPRVRARYTQREMYVAEFEAIWQKQAEHLCLHLAVVPIRKVISLSGNLNSTRNRKRIHSLQEKFGQNDVIISDSTVMVQSEVPFKEYLAGNIETDEDGIKFRSNESVLFWQRPLRSQKGMLAKCTFESRDFFDKKTGRWRTIGSTPCPLSHPDFELFRAYQFINNIRYGHKKEALNDEYREQVLQLMHQKDGNFDFAEIPKKLKLTFEQFNYEDKLKVPGNTTHKRLMSLFEPEVWAEEREKIWHYFYFYTDPAMLSAKLVERYGFTADKAQKASSLQLKEGYGNVSLKAIRNILPFLMAGYQYSTAVVLGGVRNAFGERWEYFRDSHQLIEKQVVDIVRNEQHQEFGLIKRIKELLSDPVNQYGFATDDKAFAKLYHHSQEIEQKKLKRRLSEVENLRNPIVQKGLHEMRRLVNALLDKMDQSPEYGPSFSFDRIHVELSRDLRNSKSQRQDMTFRNRDNEAANEEARVRLQEYGLKASRENITKYRLYKEIQEKNGSVVCPYTNKTISINDLLGTGNLFQIEHIIPYSISLDDSFANKTLCESNFNRNKGEKTPYEYHQRNSSPGIWGANSWDEIEQRAFSILPYHKARRFVARKQFLTEGFIERQLNDGRYISKKAAQQLSEVCEDVRVMPGQLTSELRRLWGLNNIIQPVSPLHLEGVKVDADEAVPHYIVIDGDANPVLALPKNNELPTTSVNQMLLPGFISEKGLFNPNKDYKHLKLTVQTEALPKGRYWAKVNVSDPIRFTRVFIDKPLVQDNEIVYRGRVEKGAFINDSIGKRVTAKVDDGYYWAKFQVNKTTFVEPGDEKPVTKGRNQVLLFGTVNDQNLFTSYIFQCASNLNPGKYWAILELDFETAEFSRAVVSPDSQEENLIIYGTVKDDGGFVPDCDPAHKIKTPLEPGRYFATMELEGIEGFYATVNPEPLVNKGETLIEGNVWVNKQTGEIMFDPKKNRDDHRHHAVDAIAIAFTELGYLQKLSRYFGEMKDKERGIGDRPSFAPPWQTFTNDVAKAVDGILVSYSASPKVMSKISKEVVKDGKKHHSVGYAARGKMHREYYFGRHPRMGTFGSEGVGFEKDRQGNIVQYYHIRKSITAIENHKHVAKIVDDGIRNLILQKLQERNIDVHGNYQIPANFFMAKDGTPMLFLPNKRGEPVPVKKVRMRESMGNAVQLKENVNQWVNPYNNHHVVIYRDMYGELKELVVSFWEVIERAQQGQSVYQLPGDGHEMVTTMQVNDMFLLNLPEDIRSNLDHYLHDTAALSPYLYRVQKLSSRDYNFRNHLASTILNDREAIRINSLQKLLNAKPLKVEVGFIGNLKYCKLNA